MPSFLIVVLIILPLMSGSCPQIDFTHTDFDGMAFCPDQVQSTSAFAVYGCAMDQANSFHTPTPDEEKAMHGLLRTFRSAVVAGKPSLKTTKMMLGYANDLNLQACRVSRVIDNKQDSYLLFYTKPGIRNYSGPFMLARETNHSKLALIGPHDDSDGTFTDTKLGVQDTHAIILFSNGHKRGSVRTPTLPKGGDFVHETDNLGTHAVRFFGNLFPQYVWLHIHGMAADEKVLVRSHDAQLQQVFEHAIEKYTGIDSFQPLNAYFTVDNEVNSQWYLKTEIPARIHEVNHMIIANIVKYIEQFSWAWDQ